MRYRSKTIALNPFKEAFNILKSSFPPELNFIKNAVQLYADSVFLYLCIYERIRKYHRHEP